MRTFKAHECKTPSHAIQYSEAAGGQAIRYRGKSLVVSERVADRLVASDEDVAFLCVGPFNRIMTVPMS